VRAIVVGIDGGGWNFLLDSALADSGRVFREVSSDSPSGDLISTVPPVTGPAWVSFATGCNPGEHGCFGFLMPAGGLTETSPINSKNISRPTFYEILEKVGKKSILINLPCSYPPRIPGVVITGLMTSGDRYIFPGGIEDEYRTLRKYRPFPDQGLMARRKTAEHLEDIRDVEERRFRCARELFESSWDFFFVLFSGLDWALHSSSGGLREASENAGIRRIVGDIGRYLNWFVENCPPDAYLLLVSDHGFTDYNRTFYPNALLRERGLLDLTERERGIEGPHRMYREYSSRSLNLGVPRPFVSLLRKSPRLMNLAFKTLELSPVQVKSKTRLVLSGDTRAACISPGMSRYGTVYLSENDGSLLGRVREELLAARDPSTGEEMVDRVWTRDEIYHGRSLGLGPHLVIRVREGCWVNNDLTFPRTTSTEREVNHGLLGIYALVANGYAGNADFGRASIEDVAPTVLANYSLPLPGWLDGRPIFRLKG